MVLLLVETSAAAVAAALEVVREEKLSEMQNVLESY
jgi:hypothetical protein